MPRKLGKNTTQRLALIKNQASNLLWNGKIETTVDRAKEVRSYVEKVITSAIKTYTDIIETETVEMNEKGKEVKKTIVKDGAKKLAARRRIMTKLCDLKEVQGENESKSEFKNRTKDIKHPLIEKLFNEIAPKYATRAEQKGQGGGYTRIIRLGERKGDNAEVCILQLVD
jgi:large subunit ribosomal protein L17